MVINEKTLGPIGWQHRAQHKGQRASRQRIELDHSKRVVIKAPSWPSIRLPRNVIVLDVQNPEPRAAVVWVRR